MQYIHIEDDWLINLIADKWVEYGGDSTGFSMNAKKIFARIKSLEDK